VDTLTLKNSRARLASQSSLVEEVVENILDAGEGTAIHVGFPEWFIDAVRAKNFSDVECEAIVERVYDVLTTVVRETLTEDLQKIRGKSEPFRWVSPHKGGSIAQRLAPPSPTQRD
jgi:hypothetical protein